MYTFSLELLGSAMLLGLVDIRSISSRPGSTSTAHHTIRQDRVTHEEEN